MLNKIYKTSLLLITITPVFVFAQLDKTSDILYRIKNMVTDILIPLAFTLALLSFFWGVAKYIWSEDKEEGKKVMVWGVIALFVMSSVWGLVYFLRGELDINDANNMPIPNVEGGGSTRL